MKGDLDSIQKSVLAYLMYREKKSDRLSNEERFKELLVAHHPERAREIMDGFKKDETLVDAMDEDELAAQQGYNPDEIEAAHEIFAKLFSQGGAIVPYDD